MDEIVVRNDWPRPDAGAPEPQVRASESELVLTYRVGDGGVAVVRLAGVTQFQFGWPNDEMLHAHPLYARGLRHYSAHEVRDSVRASQLMAQNAEHPEHERAFGGRALRHYVLTFHDSTFECLVAEAPDAAVDVRVVSDEAARAFRKG